MMEFIIHGVALNPKTGMPLVILLNTDKKTCVGIEVGPSEASSIIVELEGVQPPRPLTHDLLGELFIRHGFFLNKIEIYDHFQQRSMSRIHYTQRRRRYSMETRPSDALALAVRLNAPIFVNEECIPALFFASYNPESGENSEFLYLEKSSSAHQAV